MKYFSPFKIPQLSSLDLKTHPSNSLKNGCISYSIFQTVTSSLSISNFSMINGTMAYSILILWFGNLNFLEIWRFSFKCLFHSPPPQIVYEFFNYILFILLRREFGIWCAIFSFWIWIVVLLGFEPQKCVLVFFLWLQIFWDMFSLF